MFDVKGYPTSAGSPTLLVMSGEKPESAAAVEMLLAAGACFPHGCLAIHPFAELRSKKADAPAWDGTGGRDFGMRTAHGTDAPK